MLNWPCYFVWSVCSLIRFSFLWVVWCCFSSSVFTILNKVVVIGSMKIMELMMLISCAWVICPSQWFGGNKGVFLVVWLQEALNLGFLSFYERGNSISLLALLIRVKERGFCGWEVWCSWVLVDGWVSGLTLVNSRFRFALNSKINAFKIWNPNAAPLFLRVHSMLTESFFMNFIVGEQGKLFTLFFQPAQEVNFLPHCSSFLKCSRISSEFFQQPSVDSVFNQQIMSGIAQLILLWNNHGSTEEVTTTLYLCFSLLFYFVNCV